MQRKGARGGVDTALSPLIPIGKPDEERTDPPLHSDRRWTWMRMSPLEALRVENCAENLMCG